MQGTYGQWELDYRAKQLDLALGSYLRQARRYRAPGYVNDAVASYAAAATAAAAAACSASCS